uniref:Uncharacterized protein n=1 Tax=viral metagenome TaxID=1070528 RepID=A0A6C0F6B4_9ZZZZ
MICNIFSALIILHYYTFKTLAKLAVMSGMERFTPLRI